MFLKKFIQILLFPLTIIYWIITEIRNLLFDKKILASKSFDSPIILVGNITVGGTGKTPHIEYLIRLLQNNYKTACLSRGYGRKTKGYIKLNSTHNSVEVGDEPKQLKNKFNDITVAVSESRVLGVENLIREVNPEIILLDDAFQHRHIKAGLNILLIDYNRPIFKDFVFPSGRLREAAKNSKRAELILISKSQKNISEIQKQKFIHHLKLKKHQRSFFTHITYGALEPVFKEHTQKYKETQSVILVTGIAQPKPLEDYIQTKYNLLEHLKYTDHHEFSKNEIAIISKKAFEYQKFNPIIITTEKDSIRLKNIIDDLVLKEKLYFVPIKIDFNTVKEQKIFNQIIINYVEKI